MPWINFIHLFPKDERLCKCLWAAGYCCQLIPHFTALAKSLYDLLLDTVTEPFTEALTLDAWKSALPRPQITWFWQTFHLYCHENCGIASGILEQLFLLRYSRKNISHVSWTLWHQAQPYAPRQLPQLPPYVTEPVPLHQFPLFTFVFLPVLSALLQVHKSQHLSTQQQTTYE